MVASGGTWLDLLFLDSSFSGRLMVRLRSFFDRLAYFAGVKPPRLEANGCLKNIPGSCAIREPLSSTSHMPESGGGRVERMVVPRTGQKLDRPRLSHVLNG